MPKTPSATPKKNMSTALTVVSVLLRLILGSIFIWSGWQKLAHLDLFYQTAQGYHILTPALTQIYAGWLPWLEIIGGVCLVLGLFQRFGAGLISLLLLSFLIATGWVLLRGDTVDCGCFLSDVGKSPVTWELWFRDLFMLAGSVGLMFLKTSPLSLDLKLPAKTPARKAVGIALVLALCGSGLMALQSKIPPPPPPPNEVQPLLSVGTMAPPFSLSNLDGKTITLKQFQYKKTVLIEFFATWCPHCLHSVPLLKQLHQAQPKLEILAINSGDAPGTPSTGRAFQQSLHIPYTILEKPTPQLIADYHLTGFPTFYLINPAGQIIWTHAGKLTPPDYQALITTLSTPPTPNAAL